VLLRKYETVKGILEAAYQQEDSHLRMIKEDAGSVKSLNLDQDYGGMLHACDVPRSACLALLDWPVAVCQTCPHGLTRSIKRRAPAGTYGDWRRRGAATELGRPRGWDGGEGPPKQRQRIR
jgi:hypothetical protein